MKKLTMLLMSMLFMAMAIPKGVAQEVTITLIPGWTWISYPSADTLDFATAFGDFVPMQGDLIRSQWGQATYTNGRWRGSTSQFYPGYGYQYKSNRQMPVMVTFNAQQSSSQVVVSTSEPMLITAISAMGGGEVTTTDGTYIIVKGLCWAAHENPTTNDDFYEEAESGVGTFSISMTELNMATTYYVRAYAVTPNGTVYGDQKSFTTRDGIPTLTTAEITNLTCESATCGGEITDNGGLNVTERGVCWSTSPNPTVSDSHTTNGTGTGSFTSSITGLGINTTYYVRAYATTSAGTGYGEEKTFITRDGIPILTTADITSISEFSAIGGGTITDDGGLSIIARGVCWNTSSTPTLADSHTTNGSEIGVFSSNITGLNVNTTYYVRAYATNSFVTVYGNEVSFTTTKLWENGILPGGFSVSSTQQVQFSQGNLQYQASTNTWRFAGNQYDCIGNSNSNISSFYNGWIDLFGWGTSGYHDSNDLYNVNYQPWSISTSYGVSDYNSYGYGPSTNMADPNLTGTSVNYDWGIYNPIDNGNNTTNKWRTLTYDEWNYVLFTRNTFSGIRYAKAIVNNINGLILLPDDWNSAIYNLSNTNANDASFESNVIDVSQWCILENNGAVFLPTTGYRYGTSIYAWGSIGEYWSTTYEGSWSADCVYIYESGLFTGTDEEGGRSHGKSVRLVSPMQPMVTTNGVTNITETTATCGGNIANCGFYPVTTCGICWSTEPNPSIDDNVVIAYGVNVGEYSLELTNLVSTTDYYVRAFATNSMGTNYGSEMRFVTAGGSGGVNAPTGAINGLFSVDASSQVYFSQGNLQYRPSTSTWRFAYNQNSYVGGSNSNITPTYNGWIDLFSWGTGDNPTNTYGNDVFVDWGNNPISNGGNTPNTWRTLTRDEWDYIFNIRSTTMGVRYAKAQVEGVNGVILLPDNWSISTYSLSNTNNGQAQYSINEISESQWIILENAGAVFLPAAGERIKYSTYYSINNVGTDGYYWSAAPRGTVSFGEYYLGVHPGFAGIRGQSVRLVYSAE